jgi:hypothetical protein
MQRALGIQARHLQRFHVKHCHPGGSAAIVGGCLPFMASQTLPGPGRRDQVTKSASEAKARQLTTSKGRSGFDPGMHAAQVGSLSSAATCG